MPAPFNLSEGKGKEALGRSAKLVTTHFLFYSCVVDGLAVAAAFAKGAHVSSAHKREPIKRNFGANISDGVNRAAL